jgi:hypothetical protein
MVKRIFALVSVSAVAAAFSSIAATGCSSSDKSSAIVQAEAGTLPALADGGQSEASAATDGGSTPATDAGGGCMEKNAIDATQFPYTTAEKAPGSCSQADLDALSKFFADNAGVGDIKISDWEAKVTPGCATCVFSDGTGTTWTPILTSGDTLKDVNRGGCIEIVSGKKACGQAYQQATECRMSACLTTCTTQDDFNTCLSDSASIFTGPCKDAYAAITTQCGNDLDAYENACKGTTWTFEGPVRVQCITGGAGDGG